MQESYGGILNIVFIVVFLVIIEGILGFVVCYTKAFRMKNAVISTLEKYEGASGCSSAESGCRSQIDNSARKLGYSPSSLMCPSGWTAVAGGDSGRTLFCLKCNPSDSGKKYIFSVITQVDINIPIIKNIMGLSFFQVHGDTKAITVYNPTSSYCNN